MADYFDLQGRTHARHHFPGRSIQRREQIKFEGGLVAVVVILLCAIIFIIGCLVYFCIGIRKDWKKDRQRRTEKEMEQAAKLKESIHQPLQMRIDDFNAPIAPNQWVQKKHHYGPVVPPAPVAGPSRR